MIAGQKTPNWSASPSHFSPQCSGTVQPIPELGTFRMGCIQSLASYGENSVDPGGHSWCSSCPLMNGLLGLGTFTGEQNRCYQ